jgi:DNA-binding LytR/AlgR family response regulator
MRVKEKTMRLKALVIDDEPLSHEIIKKYAENLTSIEIAGFCSDAIEAFEMLNKQPIDLIFLDINMPKLTGIDFLKTLQNPPMVILTTAYTDYALEGYELNVLDYLTKPFSFQRFIKAVQKAEQQNTLKINSETYKKPETIFIKSNKKSFQVRISEILYIEGLGDYTKVYTDKTHFVANISLKRMEDLLPTQEFVRIHKSYLINTERIVTIEGNMIEIAPNKKLPIGNNFKSVFFERIGKISI